MKTFHKKVTLTLVIITSILFPFSARAENKISVKYVVAEKDLGATQVFDSKNIYPSWSESKIIRIKNESDLDSADIFLKFDSQKNSRLGEKISIYTIRVADESYRIGGIGDHWNINDANGKNLFIDKLKPGESNFYKIKIEFDKDAGNEYQGLPLKFKLGFKIQSRTNNNSSDENIILANQERVGFTGNSPESTSDNTATVLSESKNENTTKPSIMGARDKNECFTWPAYVWVLALIFYAFIFNLNSAFSKDSKRIKLSWQAIFTALAIFIWYRFDICKTFIWFPISIFAIVAISYQYFLHKTRK